MNDVVAKEVKVRRDLRQYFKLPGFIKKNRKLELAATALIILLVVGLVYLVYQGTRPHDDLATTQKVIASATINSKDNKAAIRALQGVRKHAATKEGKREADYILAAKYSANNDHKAALKFYKEAITLADKTDINSILGAANEASLIGDKTAANNYYQKAIDYYTPLAKSNSSLNIVITNLKNRQNALK